MFSIEEGKDNYAIGFEQGVVVRQNGNLAADFENGRFVWVNPKLQISKKTLDRLLSFCKKFVKTL